MIAELKEASELLVVVLTMWHEFGHEPYAGKVMGANVIANRAIHSSKTLKEVCLAPKQFSCWNNPKKHKDMFAITASTTTLTQNWKDCMFLAREICRKGYVPVTPAEFYFNPKLADPKWAHSKDLMVVAHVGNHIFMMRCNKPVAAKQTPEPKRISNDEMWGRPEKK